MNVERIRSSRLIAVLVLVPLLLSGCALAPKPPYPPGYDPDEYGSEPHGWARIADSPLTARHDAVAVAVGGVYLFLGGRGCAPRRCAPGAGRALRDGAAFDPATNRWTPIATAPVPITPDRLAVIGTDLYIATRDRAHPQRERFLRYDTEDDSWTRLPAPPVGPGTFTVGGGGFTVIAVADSSNGSGPADATFFPETGRWQPLLPADPIGAGTHRRLFWADGDLVLFAQPPDRGGRPALVRSTTIWSSRGWDPPQDLPLTGGDPVLTSSTFVFPDQGRTRAADGESHPNGGISTGAGWVPLPAAPAARTDRAGIDQTLVVGGSVLHDGLLLDPSRNTYRALPRFPGAVRTDAATTTDGGTLIVWGGSTRHGTDLDDGYLLYP